MAPVVTQLEEIGSWQLMVTTFGVLLATQTDQPQMGRDILMWEALA